MSESANDVTCDEARATKRQRCDENGVELVQVSNQFNLLRNEEQFWNEYLEELIAGGKGANFTDIEFICKDGSFPVHRCLLISPLLSSPLKDLLLEKREEISCVTFADFSVRHMKLALQLFYSGQCVIDKEDQMDLYGILRYLGCESPTHKIMCHPVRRADFGVQTDKSNAPVNVNGNCKSENSNDSTLASGSSSSRPARDERVNTESEQMRKEDEEKVERESVNVVTPREVLANGQENGCEVVDLTAMSDDEDDSTNDANLTTTRMIRTNPMNSQVLFNPTQPQLTRGQYGLPSLGVYGGTKPAYILGLRK